MMELLSSSWNYDLIFSSSFSKFRFLISRLMLLLELLPIIKWISTLSQFIGFFICFSAQSLGFSLARSTIQKTSLLVGAYLSKSLVLFFTEPFQSRSLSLTSKSSTKRIYLNWDEPNCLALALNWSLSLMNKLREKYSETIAVASTLQSTVISSQLILMFLHISFSSPFSIFGSIIYTQSQQ